MSHFLPVFEKQNVPDKLIDEIDDQMQEEKSRLMKERKEALDNWMQNSQGENESLQLAMFNSVVHHVAQRIDAISRFRQLQSALGKAGFVCFEVPPDGNCGVYTVACLEDGQPGAGRSAAKITAVRVFIANAWCIASDYDPIWRAIFACETIMFDGSLEEDEAGKQLRKLGGGSIHAPLCHIASAVEKC